MKRASPDRTSEAQARRNPSRAKRRRVSESANAPVIAPDPKAIPAFTLPRRKAKKRNDSVEESLASEVVVAQTGVPVIPTAASSSVDFVSSLPAPPRKRPRTRADHSQSEGESESEDPNVVWRSLRPEERPFEHGVRPPEGFGKEISASSHITSGTRAKKKR
jgi:hypothetical protein